MTSRALRIALSICFVAWLAPLWGRAQSTLAPGTETHAREAARTELGGPFWHRRGDPPPSDRAQWSLPSRGAEEIPSDPGWTRLPRVDQVAPGSGAVWIATRLPAVETGDELFMPRTYGPFDAHIGGVLRSSLHVPDAAARAFHLVPLAQADSGAWLVLRIEAGYIKAGLTGPLAVGAPLTHVRTVLLRDGARITLSFAFFFSALLALGIALRGTERRAFSFFALWSLGAAFWTAFYTQARALLGLSPGTWLLVWAVGLLVLGLGGLFFFYTLFHRGERPLSLLVPPFVVVSLAGFVFAILRPGPETTNAFLLVYRLLLALVFFAVLHVMLRRFRENNREARVFALGFAIYTPFALHDVAMSVGWISGSDTIAHFGMLALVASGAWVLVARLAAISRRLVETADALAVGVREREMMLRDLHDGLGRVTTGIGYLAQAASRQSDATRALAGIAELAEEGSREIRTIMHGLDDEHRDWAELSATLRREASRIAEASEIVVRFEFQIPSDAAPPRPYVFVQLLRTFQEGLTNAIKHGVPSSIVVVLEVSEQRVRLELENDGTRETQSAPGAINTGRGLGNLRKRAVELGGELALTRLPPNSARLSLSLPLPIRYADGSPPGAQQ
jgi:signal transduction histidine kinase